MADMDYTIAETTVNSDGMIFNVELYQRQHHISYAVKVNVWKNGVLVAHGALLPADNVDLFGAFVAYEKVVRAAAMSGNVRYCVSWDVWRERSDSDGSVKGDDTDIA